MCKAFFVRHTCNHASAPRVEKCPLKIRIGECRGVKRIELKSPRLCSICTTGLSSEHQQHLPAPRATPNLAAMKPQPRVGKKIKKTYDWMNAARKPGQKASPVDPQAQTNLKRKTASQPEKTMPVVMDGRPLTKADEKKAKQFTLTIPSSSIKTTIPSSSIKTTIPSRPSRQPSPPRPSSNHPLLVDQDNPYLLKKTSFEGLEGGHHNIDDSGPKALIADQLPLNQQLISEYCSGVFPYLWNRAFSYGYGLWIMDYLIPYDYG